MRTPIAALLGLSMINYVIPLPKWRKIDRRTLYDAEEGACPAKVVVAMVKAVAMAMLKVVYCRLLWSCKMYVFRSSQ
ncbi:hypothetical protein BDR22DRAFT_831627 [Usnea florida]